jgi:hypothetical protein
MATIEKNIWAVLNYMTFGFPYSKNWSQGKANFAGEMKHVERAHRMQGGCPNYNTRKFVREKKGL